MFHRRVNIRVHYLNLHFSLTVASISVFDDFN